MQILSLALHVLKTKEIEKTLAEMPLGRLIHRMQLRRPCMGALTRVWKYMRRCGRRRPMPLEVEEDVLLALGCLPLMAVDLRLRLSGTVTCSDASELGNGVCVSGELTKSGKKALAAPGRSRSSTALGACTALWIRHGYQWKGTWPQKRTLGAVGSSRSSSRGQLSWTMSCSLTERL